MKEQLVLKVLELLLNDNSNGVKIIDNSAEAKNHAMVGKYCVIRTYSAGVHVGTVKSVNGTEVILEDSRRVWNWKGAFTLSEMSQKGISEGRIAVSLPLLVLTEAIEIIPCSTKAGLQLKEYKSHEV